MGLELRLTPKLVQKLIMTPNLQLAIKLLQLSKLELEEYLNEELMKNPFLEDLLTSQEDQVEGGGNTEAPPERAADEEEGYSPPLPGDQQNKETISPNEQPAEEGDTVESVEDAISRTLDGILRDASYLDASSKSFFSDTDWERIFDNGDDFGYTPSEEGEVPQYENYLSKAGNLHDHLLWQLSLSSLSEAEQKIGKQIIGNIDDYGYLRATIEEIARIEGVTVAAVEKVLRVIQDFEPSGVGARDLRECLILQLKQKGMTDTLTYRLVDENLDKVLRNQMKELSKIYKVDIDQLKKAIANIEKLEPKPGREYLPDEDHYITPDVFITKEKDGYKITLNDEGMPRLRLSSYYRRLLHNEAREPGETRKFLEDKLRDALWLIKSIEQRQSTIYRVVESIVKFQRDFLDYGIMYLKPLTLRDIAEDIGMHESTVSRITSGKYVHTPQGVFELKFFFHSGLSTLRGEDVSSLRIKEIIKDMIAQEDKKKPLSDQAIADRLEQEMGIMIKRRTIAKYREQLGIPSSNQRRTY